MSKAKLLIIDDDVTLNQLLCDTLRRRGFEVLSAVCGKEGIQKALAFQPDLIILDILMPNLDGWETCRRLREQLDVPIIMLTAMTTEKDVIQGFEIGVDDYVTKPFGLKELEMRIQAVLRRCKVQPEEASCIYDDGYLQFDPERRQVIVDGKLVRLTPTEFRLLACLVHYQGQVIGREKLLAEVWGSEYIEASANLSLYISYLRKKLEVDPRHPRYIHTEWGVGYKFMVEDG